MALSGEFGTSNQYIKYYFEVIQNWQDVGGNYSNVTVRVWFKRTNGYESYGSGTVYVNIDGGAYSASVTSSQKITSTPICLFERTVNITHNGDGTRSFSVSAYISHSVVSSSSNAWSFGLTTIPRASTPTLSNGNFTMGSAITIYTNKLANFTHTVVVTFGGYTANIAFDVVDSVTWTPPTANMAPQIPNATSGIGSITLHTYSGGTHIGSKSVGFTANLPTSVVPTFTSVTHSEGTTSPDVKTIIGSYVQNLSTLNMVINGASGVYGSSITNYTFNIDGVDYNGNASTKSNPLKASGTLTLTATITDSRGRTATKTASITVLAYEAPKITTLTVERANSDGTLNAMGTYVKVTRAGTFNTLNAKNTLTIVVKSKTRGTGTWTTKNTSTAQTASPHSSSVVLSTYSATASHDFMIEFTDKFNTTISLAVISTGQVTMSWGKTGIGIGKVWESGALDLAGDINVTGNSNVTGVPYYWENSTTVRRRPVGMGEFGQAIDMTGTDCNTDFTTGFYMGNATCANKPPSADWFFMQVLRHDPNFATQTAWDFWSNKTWERRKSNNTWSTWMQSAGTGTKHVAQLNAGGQGLAANSWYRVDFNVVDNINHGTIFNNTDNMIYPKESGYYLFTAQTYFVQQLETGFYLEIWGGPTGSTHRTVVSTWAPDNGYNYYAGSVVVWCDKGYGYEYVIKHSDTGYSRSILDLRANVIQL